MQWENRINSSQLSVCVAIGQVLIFLMLTFASSNSFANDSMAELATGGLVFTKSNDIEMQSEDLETAS